MNRIRAARAELAYSWPMLIFAAVFPVLIIRIVTGWAWTQPVGMACIFGAFACCPVRDWLIDRRTESDSE